MNEEAEVLVIVDKEMEIEDLSIESGQVLYSDQNFSYVPFDLYLLRKIFENQENLKDSDAIPVIADNWKRLIARDTALLKKQLGEECLNILLTGRVRMICLLNSIGGESGPRNEMIAVLNGFHQNGGASESYIAHQAASAAADVAAKTEKRHALRSSRVLFHTSLPPDDASDEEMAADDAEREIREKKAIIDFFEENTLPDYKEEAMHLVESAQTDPENPQSEIVLSGEQLHTYGLIHDLSSSIHELLSPLIERGSIKMSVLKQPALSRFLMNARIEEILREKGTKMNFYVSENGTLRLIQGAQQTDDEYVTEQKEVREEQNTITQSAFRQITSWLIMKND